MRRAVHTGSQQPDTDDVDGRLRRAAAYSSEIGWDELFWLDERLTSFSRLRITCRLDELERRFGLPSGVSRRHASVQGGIVLWTSKEGDVYVWPHDAMHILALSLIHI